MPISADRPGGIFFDAAGVERILATGADWVPDYLDLYESRMASLVDPDHESAHLWAHMPPPAYETTPALVVEAGERYTPSIGPSTDAGVRIEMSPEPRSRVRIDVEGLGALELVRRRKVIRATWGRDEIDLAPGELRITVRHDGEWSIAVEGDTVARIAGAGEPRRLTVEVERGSASVVMAQSLAPTPAFVFFDGDEGDRLERLARRRNPYRFEWGLRSVRMCSTFTMAAVVRDLAAAVRAGAVDLDAATADRIKALDSAYDDGHERWLRAYLAWPRWRPGVGDTPEAGSWDRNSFTNGAIPMAVAVLARLRPDVAAPAEVARLLEARGAQYFLAAESLAFSKSSRARDHKWWLRRSANHGMIMMATFASAMRLAGLADHPATRLVEHDVDASLEGLYADGSFCEGVHYNNFALAQCFALFHLRGEGGISPTLRAGFAAAYDWWSLSHDGAGRVFANFGDNVARDPGRGARSVGRFLTNHAEFALGDGVEIDEVDPQTPFVVGDKRTPPTSDVSFVARHFERNEFALVAGYDDRAARTAGLFTIGSRRQRTHNRNHDALGFAFWCDGWRIGIDDAGQQPATNNGVGFTDAGGTPVKIIGEREYNGFTSIVGEHPDRVELRSWADKVGLDFEGVGRRRLRLERAFSFRPGHPAPLVVVTRVRGASGLDVALPFNLVADGGRTPTVSTHVRTGRGRWEARPSTTIDGVTWVRAMQPDAERVVFVTVFGEDATPPGSHLGLLGQNG